VCLAVPVAGEAAALAVITATATVATIAWIKYNVQQMSRSIDDEPDQAHKKPRKSTHDKHTKRRPGGDWEKKKDSSKGWKPRK
jgi:hypothetical protein